LVDGQGRRARQNARRAVLGAVRAVANAVKAEYTIEPVIRAVEDPLVRAAKTMEWRRFEYRIIKPGRLEFTIERAQEFVNWWCARNQMTPKRVVQNIGDRRGDHRLFGQFNVDIRLEYRMSDRSKWQTLMHEVAHYKALGHRKNFVRAMAQVWTEFQLWRSETNMAKAAKTKENI
jgi:hypothetical protein